jgi:hypothetical protein
MPEQKYSIGYGTNDFFYNKDNKNIEATIPFVKGNLIAWVKMKGSEIGDDINEYNVNIFDPKITTIVFLEKNKSSFIDEFLPGNIIIDNRFSNFDPTQININVASKGRGEEKTVKISGTMDITPKTGSTIKFDLKDKNDNSDQIMNYTVNDANQMNPEFDITGIIKTNYDINGTKYDAIPYDENTTDGKYSSLISVTTKNPRCKFTKACTINHEHYDKCQTQIFKDKTGESYCRCVCTGRITKNGDLHQHCSPYNITNDGDKELNNKITLASLINNIKLNLNADFKNEIDLGRGNPTPAIPYKNADDLKANDQSLREKLYDYYFELDRNIKLREKTISNNSINNTTQQALQDANVKYKKEYLHLFNIFSGILFVSGYIYVLTKKPKT